MDVGFIGLGRMGGAMARNLARAGHRVRAWNRSPAAGDLPSGMEIVSSPGQARRAAMTVDGGFDLPQISCSCSAGRRERHAR